MKIEKQNRIINPSDGITTDIKGVMSMLGVGKNMALKVGKESGALIKLGRRSLYKVDVIKSYINSIEPEK